MSATWGVILLCLIALIISTCSCQQHVDGGNSERAARAFSLAVDSATGVVTITDSRERAATSQPSSDTYGTTPEFKGTSGEFGEIGGFKFTQMRDKPIGSWILGGICLAVAVISFCFTRNVLVASVALAIGVLAFVLPTLLGIVAVGALVVIVLLHNGGVLKRVIGSVHFAMQPLEGAEREQFKDRLEQKQSPADVAAVKALRPAA